MIKITLQVKGQEMTFSESELIAIVEKHFDSESTNPESETSSQTVQGPKEGEWFGVNPTYIDQSLFKEMRKDVKQEKTRRLIVKAFQTVEYNPEKYGKPFETMMPSRTWSTKFIQELEEMAKRIGDGNADWVEQALEWAQRIDNGETWEAVCNDIDTAMFQRLIVWKDSSFRRVGGSRKYEFNYPTSEVGDESYDSDDLISDAVPLIVRYLPTIVQ